MKPKFDGWEITGLLFILAFTGWIVYCFFLFLTEGGK